MRYYTYCNFSADSVYDNSNYLSWNDPKLASFIFVDTENNLRADSIRLPLLKLSRLYNPEPRTAFIYRATTRKLIATFSPNILTPPKSLTRWDSLARHYKTIVHPTNGELVISVLEDITDRNGRLISLDMGMQFDGCLQLNRAMGSCPCLLADTEACIEENVVPKLPSSLTLLKTKHFDEIDTAPLYLAAYRQLGEFNFVKPAHTTKSHIVSSARSWRSYDFENIDIRKEELKQRGKQSAHMKEHRRTQCSKCTFAYDGEGCGEERTCSAAVPDTTLSLLFDTWYDSSGFESMPGFTRGQVDLLVRYGGSEVYAKNVVSTRSAVVKFGFFHKGHSGKWRYVMRTSNPNSRLIKFYDDYTALQQAIPELPVAPPEQYTRDVRRLYAAMSWRGRTLAGSDLWFISLTDDTCETYAMKQWRYGTPYASNVVSRTKPSKWDLYRFMFPYTSLSTASILLTQLKGQTQSQ